MNKREDVLREALQKNDEEFQRWQSYLKENETAIENMSLFSKRLTVDVMVPVGKKALMTGHLLHTNEVLVGHYQGYFSRCTTSKAKEICEMRIIMAKDHIKKLETEADLWQNKLDKPYVEGVVPGGEEHEIIEEYNLETEKVWRENHKIRVRQAKLKEREDRERQHREYLKLESTFKIKTEEEIFKMLKEAEVMEELEQELDKLELDMVNDETIRKLMSGEMKLPQEKQRLAHETKTNQKKTTEDVHSSPNVVKRYNVEITPQVNTNNNVEPNPVIVNAMHEDVEELEDETLPEEVTLIKEQANFLDVNDQIGFYDYQIQIVRQKIQLLPLRTQRELDEKIHLLNVLEHLEELLEEAEQNVGTAELAEKEMDEEVKNEAKLGNQEKECMEITTNGFDNENKCHQKRRISFALEDQTLEFKKHEAVTQMLPPTLEKPQRDIIKIDDNSDEQKDKYKIKVENCVNKKDLIQAKVEKNLQFVEENQSKQDFDLVQQILQSTLGEINTLHIKFKHSQQEGCTTSCTKSFEIPGNPADFYNLYIKSQKLLETVTEPSTLFINSYKGEDQVKAPMLKEADKQVAFEDPKAKFSNPLEAKSILKNKSAVDKETHTLGDSQINNKKSKKKSRKVQDNDCFSAYYKVMNDVVEKPLTEPEPLPKVKFIDAHTPKKRISRFKQMRQENEKP